MLGQMEDKTYRDYANDIRTSGQHLLHLINEIIGLSTHREPAATSSARRRWSSPSSSTIAAI